MPPPTDWQLLQLHRTGDRAAIETLIHRHIHLVYATACRLVSPTEADDITQTVFLILTQKAKTLPQRESLAPWLHRATQLCASNLRKQEGRHRRHIKEAAMHSPATTSQDTPELRTQWLELLDRALLRLKEPERAVILIHHLQQQSIESTAQHLGITPEAAKKRATRALEKLRHYFARHGRNFPAASALATGLHAAATHAPAPAATTLQSTLSIAHGTPAAAHLAALAKATTFSLSTAPKIAAATAIAALLAIATTLTAVAYAHALPPKPTSPPSSAIPVSAPAPAAPAHPELVTTAPVSPPFKGWVHSPFRAFQAVDPTSTQSNNITTGAYVGVQRSPNDTQITYLNPATGEYRDYHSSTDLIRIGLLNPDRKENEIENAARIPINYATVLGQYRTLLGRDPIGITHTVDQGLDRYDFSAPREDAKKLLQTQGNDANAANSKMFDIASVIWIDPATHLTQRAQIYNSGTSAYTYGGPDITSIYDAGAPKTAKVYDNRPTPQTLAVLERVQKRSRDPLPDGVSVTWGQYEFETNLLVYEQSKNHWIERRYSVHPPKPDGYTIDLPADWATTGADEFFRRLAVTAAHDESVGSETDVYIRDFTPHAPADTQPKIYPDGSSFTIITTMHDTGRNAKSDMWIHSPQWSLFNIRVSGQYSTVNHVSLVTDPDRPGLVGIHNELRRDTPDSIRAYDEYWIDPAHADRIVQHIEESFEDPPAGPQQSAIISSSGEFKSVTDYSDFATLPDGRQYAAIATTTNYEPELPGQYAPRSTTKTIFHFFPNRTLPALVVPTTQPAPPSPNLP